MKPGTAASMVLIGSLIYWLDFWRIPKLLSSRDDGLVTLGLALVVLQVAAVLFLGTYLNHKEK